MKKVLSFLTILLFTATLFGQYDPRENFYDAEFFFAEEDYSEALYSFKKVYSDGYQENANINYRIGTCLLNIDGRKTEAIPYLLKAVNNVDDRYKEGSFKEENAPPDAFLCLGNAYRIKYNHKEACVNYNKYLEYFEDAGEDNLNVIYTKLQIEACKAAEIASSNPKEYETGTLGQLNQISAPAYNPVVSGDLSTLAFMGQHKFYNAVYVSKKIDGKWMKPKNITPDIQSDGNQSVISLSFDGNQILLTWSDEFNSEIWITEFSNDKWTKSKALGKPVNSKYYESHAAFTPDGNTIYFTSNRKESLGEMDIFKCNKNDDGTWGDMILLGEKINTLLNEDTPYVSPDGKRLYFSSQGNESLGGYDIYYSEIHDDGTYGDPVSLGYPLNTSDDDFTFSPKQMDDDAYMTLYSKGEAEQVDLFRFELIPESADPVIVAFIEEVVEETGDAKQEVVESEEVVMEELITKAKKYLIKPVFFDFDSDELSATAIKKLDDLATILNKFPYTELQIKGHTDAVGTNNYNLILSKKRAKAVSLYLQMENIDKKRLVLSGLSESDPAAINRTKENKDAPEGRQLNRRVEFEVKLTGNILIEIARVDVPDYLKIK